MISRREFVNGAVLAGGAGALGLARAALAAGPPPETRRIRLARVQNNCWAPQYMAEDLLRAEGFSSVEYVRLASAGDVYQAIASGRIDLTMAFSSGFVLQADSGAAITMLAGVHPGCQELVATREVRTVRDLKGKSVAVTALNNPNHGFLAAVIGHVGLDPRRDIKWVEIADQPKLIDQLAEGRVHATIVSPPISYELRARKIGHVLVNMTTDRPWSQYFCCVLTGNREFVRRNPAGTKRAMRAILKGADLCGGVETSAKHLLSRGYYKDPNITLQMLRDLPYARWRDFDTEDTVRYYALRLHEAGMIKSSPKKILAEMTDFRILNELRKELKA